MRKLIARLILAPWVAWMTLFGVFWLGVFLIPLVPFVILEWLVQMAKGSNQTFRDAWRLGWKDSLAKFVWRQITHPLR